MSPSHFHCVCCITAAFASVLRVRSVCSQCVCRSRVIVARLQKCIYHLFSRVCVSSVSSRCQVLLVVIIVAAVELLLVVLVVVVVVVAEQVSV